MDLDEDYSEDYSPGNSQSDDSSQSSSQASPAELAITTFLGYLRGFLGANANRVNAAYDSGAGWEIWLHVELYQYIVAQRGNDNGIVREPNAYPHQGRLRADFTIAWGCPPIPIEIKCETERESAAAFGGRVNSDLTKVESLNSPALVVAVALTVDSRDQMQSENVETITVGNVRVYLGIESTF
jgi:hypothetical protein